MPVAEAQEAACLVSRLISAPMRAINGVQANARMEEDLQVRIINNVVLNMYHHSGKV